MSTIVTLTPDSTTSNSGFTVGGGAADVDDAIRDTHTSDYIRSTHPTTGLARVTLDDYALGSNQRIARVRARCRLFGPDVQAVSLRLRESTTNVESLNVFENPGANPGKIYTGTWINGEPISGGEWDETTLNALSLELSALGFTQANIGWADVQADIRDQANVSFIAPSSSPVDPEFRVRWSIDNTDTPTKYQVKIFTRAIAEGGGFDPATSANVYDSGILNWPGVGQHDIPDGFLTESAEYYVYVKTATSFNGTDWYSDWAGKYFKVRSLPDSNPTTPTGTIANAQPDLVYAYSDADGKPEAYTEIRIYERPGGSWTGFDPDVTEPDSDKSFISTGGTYSLSVAGLILQNGGVYRFYARGVSALGHVGAWDFNDFTVVLDPPPTPDLTVTPEILGARVKLDVGQHINLLTANQSSVETNTTGFVVDTNATIARVTTQFDHGVASLELTRGGAASLMSASTLTGLNGVPVTVGVQYTARAKFKTAVTARTCVVKIRWYDAAGATLSTTTGSGVADSSGAWTECTATGTAPANAAFAAVIFEVQGTLGAAEKHFVDRIGLAYGTTATAPWSLGGFSATLAYTLERSEDGISWVPVRNASATLMPTQTVTLYDNEAPFNRAMTYRASLTGISTGGSVASGFNVSSEVTLVVNRVWVKDPYDSNKNRHILVNDGWWQRRKRRRRAFYEPLNREDVVVMRGKGKGDSFTATFLTLNEEAQEELEALLDTDGPLLVQSARKQWYVEVEGDYDVNQSLWDELHGRQTHAQLYSVPFKEVGRPV